MEKQQIVTLLDKIIETVDRQKVENWPSNINYEICFNEIKVGKIDLHIKRCHVCVWEMSDGLGIVFKVGTNSINRAYDRSNFILTLFCPVWQRWRKLKKKVLAMHKLHRKYTAQKLVNEQVEVFNSLYYSQFPDEIDDILLDDTGDTDD